MESTKHIKSNIPKINKYHTYPHNHIKYNKPIDCHSKIIPILKLWMYITETILTHSSCFRLGSCHSIISPYLRLCRFIVAFYVIFLSSWRCQGDFVRVILVFCRWFSGGIVSSRINGGSMS